MKLNEYWATHHITKCMRFKKKCVNIFQRLHFFFHPNFASFIINEQGSRRNFSYTQTLGEIFLKNLLIEMFLVGFKK